MQQTQFSKQQIKKAIVEAIKDEAGIKKIIIMGSFLYSENPGDIDVVVLGTYNTGYLEISMRLRKKVRHISKIIPVDIIPIQEDAPQNTFTREIEKGEVVYER